MVWAPSSADSNTVVALPLASRRKTLAFDPPAAYRFPLASARRSSRYARFASANSVKRGARKSLPSLRIAAPFAVPLSNSSNVDCFHQRVCSASTGAPASSTAAAPATRVRTVAARQPRRDARQFREPVRMRLLTGRYKMPPRPLLDSYRDGSRALNHLFEGHRPLSSRRFPHHQRAGRAAALIEEVDLRSRRIRHHLVLHEHGRRRLEQCDIEPVVAPLAIQHGDELLEGLYARLRARDDAHPVQRTRIAHQHLHGSAARRLRRDGDLHIADNRRATVWPQLHLDFQGIARRRFGLIRPRTLDGSLAAIR